MAASQATPNPEHVTTQPPAEDRRRFLVQALTAAGGAAAFMTGLPAQAATIPRHNSSKVLDRAGIGVEANPLERMLDDLASPLANDRISRPGTELPGLRRSRVAAHGPAPPTVVPPMPRTAPGRPRATSSGRARSP